jgi:transcriptional regulator with XRE-family HTH domain
MTEPERRDWLAAARERTGRSQESLAHHLGVSTKAVSYWERGVTMPRIDIRRDLAESLGLTLDELSRRLGLAAAPEPASLNGNSASPFAAITEWLTMFVRAEQSAYAIWTLVMTALPALCQNAEYARAVERSGYQGFGIDEVEHLVKLRLARAKVLETADYTALIPAYLLDAADLASAQVMAAQAAHLLDLANRPNVTLHIFEPRHLSSVPYNEFTLLGTAGPDPDTVTEFAFGEALSRHSPDVVADRVKAFAHLASLALDPEESREAITRSTGRYAALASLQKGPTP